MNARTRQKEATRASILQAALEEFSERGFDGASTRNIAAKAGVHHALIKYHFNSKDELWRSAVTFLFERQASDMALPEDAHYADRRAYAAAVIRRIVLYSARHPEHARLMVQETCSDSERFHWAADTFIKGTAEAAKRFIMLLQKDGFLPPASVPALAYIFVGAAQLIYTLAPEARRVWEIDPSDPKIIEDHADALIAVLLR